MTLKIQGAAPGAITRKEWNLIQKAAYADVADFWHRRIRPKHFTQTAKQEYRYAHRDSGYVEKKRRKFGHTLPLVYTGRSMRRTATRRISASSKRATVVMKAGNIGIDKFQVEGGIDTADELTRISPGDRKMLARHLARFVETALRDVRVAKEIKI